MNNRRGRHRKNANATHVDAPTATLNPATTPAAAATINTTAATSTALQRPRRERQRPRRYEDGDTEFFDINEISGDNEEDGAPIIVAPNRASSPLQTNNGALNPAPTDPLAMTPTNPLATTPTNPLTTTLFDPLATTPTNPLATHDGRRKQKGGAVVDIPHFYRTEALRKRTCIPWIYISKTLHGKSSYMLLVRPQVPFAPTSVSIIWTFI
ncbi:hypothetical protein C8R48DRAFT_678955 [Suillus tomentosus]|nr:hypothetical protein C8R48DRAFT_678955 [Suillus tomentosus]